MTDRTAYRKQPEKACRLFAGQGEYGLRFALETSSTWITGNRIRRFKRIDYQNVILSIDSLATDGDTEIY